MFQPDSAACAAKGLLDRSHWMRVVPAAQGGELFNWLNKLYPICAHLTPDMIRVSTLTAMAELTLSGCTTSSDHLYLDPNGCRHDARRHAMLRIVVAPCSPFSDSRTLMRESAALARRYGVSRHTHLAENASDVAYSREQVGMTPAEYAEDCGWVGHDVWHAHCVRLDAAGIALFARTGTGVGHCPCSNMRLSSGIAPVRRLLDAGVAVGPGRRQQCPTSPRDHRDIAVKIAAISPQHRRRRGPQLHPRRGGAAAGPPCGGRGNNTSTYPVYSCCVKPLFAIH